MVSPQVATLTIDISRVFNQAFPRIVPEKQEIMKQKSVILGKSYRMRHVEMCDEMSFTQ